MRRSSVDFPVPLSPIRAVRPSEKTASRPSKTRSPSGQEKSRRLTVMNEGMREFLSDSMWTESNARHRADDRCTGTRDFEWTSEAEGPLKITDRLPVSGAGAG